MKKTMLIIIGILALYLVLQIVYSGRFYIQSRNLVKTTYTQDVQLGNKSNRQLEIFIAGDSVATGVGASSFDTSVSGRVANYLAEENYVVLTNRAENGNRMADMLSTKPPEEKQDLVILIVSSNNLLNFTSLFSFEEETKEVLEKYAKLTDKLIIVGPGRVFEAAIIPFPVRLIHKIQAPKYAEIISKEAKKYSNVVHISPLAPPVNPSDYKKDTSSDGLHPNDEGHRFWFDMIKSAL
ncbi:MAG: SGNH/GDSL hydrolase family protein [Candidatus Woykebacteria bacterium]